MVPELRCQRPAAPTFLSRRTMAVSLVGAFILQIHLGVALCLPISLRPPAHLLLDDCRLGIVSCMFHALARVFGLHEPLAASKSPSWARARTLILGRAATLNPLACELVGAHPDKCLVRKHDAFAGAPQSGFDAPLGLMS
jgi:hypothetical protein